MPIPFKSNPTFNRTQVGIAVALCCSTWNRPADLAWMLGQWHAAAKELRNA